MARKKKTISSLHSLRTQLCLGSFLLLSVTIAMISYALMIHQKSILEAEMEQTIVFQGRNTALSSEKLLLRQDPEFELFPMVKRITSSDKDVTSLVITDSEGMILGEKKLNLIGKKYRLNLKDYTPVQSNALGEGESLYQNDASFFFTTPIKSSGKEVGRIFLTYSKASMQRAMQRALIITLICSGCALLLSFLLSLAIFRRISHPMDDLVQGVDKLASGRLDTRIKLKSRNEFSILADSFNDMAARIAKAQDEMVVKERMERELELARDIQQTLLPKEVWQPEGYEIAAYYNSANEVGGDYFDVIRIDEHRTALAMADVSGKGVPGMVIMAMVKALVQQFSSSGLSPKEVLLHLNRSLKRYMKKNMFVTLIYSILDVHTGKLTFANAGHNPLLHYKHRDARCTFLKMKGMPLGIIPERHFASQLGSYTLDLAANDLILQYTDGLNESRNKEGVLFDFSRILSTCNSHAIEGARALVSNLARAEQTFRDEIPQNDDITILALSRKVEVGAEAFRSAVEEP
jgi:serine phosphatase RsbU (regulator of sigma subunit)